MLNESSLQHIQSTLAGMQKPVKLILFTSETGCSLCPKIHEVAQAIKSRAPKVALEVYDKTMDRDKVVQFGIQQVPSLVVHGMEGQTVTFCGEVGGITLNLLLDAIIGISNGKIWFPHNIRTTLKLLVRDVHIQVFVDVDCSLCKPVAETAMALALEDNHVYASIIVADDFPELKKKYDISEPPKTVFGENLHLDGHVTESTFLEMIFKAEGLKPSEAIKRCVVCGNDSAEIICTSCKSKIQAEAVEHKRGIDKFKEHGTVVKPRKNP